MRWWDLFHSSNPLQNLQHCPPQNLQQYHPHNHQQTIEMTKNISILCACMTYQKLYPLAGLSMVSMSYFSALMYSGPPHGGDRKTTSACNTRNQVYKTFGLLIKKRRKKEMAGERFSSIRLQLDWKTLLVVFFQFFIWQKKFFSTQKTKENPLIVCIYTINSLFIDR